MPSVSSGMEYGKNNRTTKRKMRHPAATRAASGPRAGRCNSSLTRSTGSRSQGPGGGSAPRPGDGASGGGSSVVVTTAPLRGPAPGEVGAVGRLGELAEVEAGSFDLHVAAGLAVVRGGGVLVPVDEPCVLYPVPVAGRHRQEGLAGRAPGDGRQLHGPSLHVGRREAGPGVLDEVEDHRVVASPQ